MILDWINPDEYLELIVLIGLLHWVGRQMMPIGEGAYRWARRVTGAALIGYGFCGVCAWQPTTAGECVSILVRSILFSGVVYGLSKILFPAAEHIYEHTFKKWAESAKAAAAMRKYQMEQKRQELEEERRKKAAQERHERLEAERAMMPPPPPKATPYEEATREHDATVAELDKLPLEPAERESIARYAKQALLRKLKKLMDHAH